MNKFVLRFLKNPVFPFFLMLALLIPSFISLVRNGFFPMQDDLQAFRIFELGKCWVNFQFPCRWIPDAGFGYGYPLFNYYSPLVYYLGSLIHLIGFQVIDAVKILFILGFLLSGIFMYILVKEFTDGWGAMAASLFFVYAPFRAAQVYVRGALAEFFVMALFPLTFWATYKLIKSKEVKYFIIVSISLALLPLTHNLLPVIFAPLLALWAVYWLIVERDKKSLVRLVLATLTGLGVSAFFVLPVIFEQKFVHTETLLGGYFDYRQHFVNFTQLFFSNHWGYGSSQLGPGDDLALSTGIIHWIGGLVTLLFAIFTFKKNRKMSGIVIVLSGAVLVYLFLMHQKSSFIWSFVPVLKWLQFPWRILSITTFIFSFLVGLVFVFLKKHRVKVALLLTVILGLVYAGFFHPKSWFNLTDAEKFSGQNWDRQLTISIFDYLPIYAKMPPDSVAPSEPEILSGEAKFTNYEKGSNFQEGNVTIIKDALIRAPLYDFPGMRVYLNGKIISHTHSECGGEKFCLGLISFNVPVGDHAILIRLENTWPRTLGNTVSIVGVISLVVIYAKKYIKLG